MDIFTGQDQQDAGGGAYSELPQVVSVHGATARVGLSSQYLKRLADSPPTVGKFLGIRRGTSLLIGMITEVTIAMPEAGRARCHDAVATVDLLGEIFNVAGDDARFERGVTNYPAIGDPAALMTSRELAVIFEAGADTICLGDLHQDPTIGARISIDDMISKHFAVLGTTGVGKSSGVALILNRIMDVRPKLRIFLLDGHNEYGRCFGDRAQVLNPGNVKLPFWLFNFEELVDVIFGGRPGVDEEMAILQETIPLAKVMYAHARTAERPGLRRADPKSAGFTVDTPVPYRLDDLLAMIDDQMGKLENRSSRTRYSKLLTRIETVRNDPRYVFMFDNANVGGDTMAEVLRQLFLLSGDDTSMTVMQLAGFPVEVVDSVVSVLCRMAFDLGVWSDGAVPLLFVCEEAHRYASADRSFGFGPTRRALSRIAKEGRKYGVFLALVTQRPAELDPTIISQCSTLFAMRMANDRDQALLRSAVSDAAANLLAFISSLGTREVLAFGEGIALPSRFKFSMLEREQVPHCEMIGPNGQAADGDFLDAAIARWRGATMSAKRPAAEEAGQEAKAPPLAPTIRSRLDPQRYTLLKTPRDEHGRDQFAAVPEWGRGGADG